MLLACNEEDRRAWVSILPSSDDEGETADTTGTDADVPAELVLAPDSSAVLLGPDTLFTAGRIPNTAPGSDTPIARRMTRAIPSSDSTSVAFVTAGPDPVVGFWSRARQIAVVVGSYPGGEVDTVAWSPDGRFLAHGARGADGLERVGAYDTRVGARARHSVVTWLARADRGVELTGWRSDDVLEVLVVPPGGGGGLAHVWDLGIDRFQLADHVDLLPRLAPPNTFLVPNGVFSLDLLGDAGIETVALYRSGTDGMPGSLVLLEGPRGPRVVATKPLVPAPAVGLEKWTDVESGPGLYGIADLGVGPFVLLTMPSARAPLTAIAFFRPRADGRMELIEAETPRETGPAIFYDGRSREGASEIGMIDLDGDGDLEVIRAEAHLDVLTREALWDVEAYDWRAGRLVHDPALQPPAREAVERLGRGSEG